MNIQAISAAATVAVLCAIVFFLAARSWQGIARVLSGQPNFADSIMSEAAQRFRDEARLLSNKQSTYLGAGLVFLVMYATATVFEAPELFAGYPEWQLYPLLAALIATALFALYRLGRIVACWRQTRFVRDANIAIGHQLQRIAVNSCRVFHDVPTAAGVVDHLMISHDGVYTINVVAKPCLKRGSVRLDDKALQFSCTAETLSIVDIVATTKQLNTELCKLTSHNIRVRCVIAVPGWDVQDQSNIEYLLVNERTLPMMRGWKDQADYLMNEDVTALQDALTESCKLSNS